MQLATSEQTPDEPQPPAAEPHRQGTVVLLPEKARAQRLALGIDIGGTGVKAGLVDMDSGALVGKRLKVATPQPATVGALAKTVRQLVEPLLRGGQPLDGTGVAFPAVVRRGVALSAVNVSKEWLYTDVSKIFSEALGREVHSLNDSDAAAFAEARFGAGRHQSGTTVTATLGTGVGTGLVIDGTLIPNIELGCLSVRGKPAGVRLAKSVRERKDFSWTSWARDLEGFVDALDEAVAPDMVIVGGGISSKAHYYLPLVRCRPLVVAARLRNNAGIIGAASYAAIHQAQPGSIATSEQLVDAEAERV
jgi:polyphosphate glucokinase